MRNLLHIDASIQGDSSVSRRLTARAVAAWQAANPESTVTYRDLGTHPVPHLDAAGGMGRLVPSDQHTPEQAASWALTERLVGEVAAADTVVLGLPLYNYGAPSTVKAWVDHLIAPGIAFDPETMEGLLSGRDFVVIATRGGGYADDAPRAGWDHAETWLPHGVALLGLEPRFITAELTLAKSNPAMAPLIPQADESLRNAEVAIDELWVPSAVSA
jgi:FMN-dependent NADH-azoreductase